jgi:peptide deformylase
MSSKFNLKLRYLGDPLLRQRSKEVNEITQEIKDFVKEMIDFLYQTPTGCGLAAPQVGRLSRIFIIRPEIKDKEGKAILGPAEVYINPKISNPSDELEITQEGCLSIPGVYVDVIRPCSIHVEALNIDGEKFSKEVHGFNAVEIMHENDHLNGKLFIDRVSKKDKVLVDPLLRKIKNSKKL